MKSGKIIVVIGPSGAGKSSFIKKILSEVQELESTVTYTTRKIRKGEKEGQTYHFIDPEEFKHRVKQDFFVEWAEVHSHLYGTAKHQILDIWKKNKAVITDLDIQGARAIKDTYPHMMGVFILPPNREELHKRMKKRGDLEKKEIELRLTNAGKEIEAAQAFDFTLINHHFQSAYEKFKAKIQSYLSH